MPNGPGPRQRRATKIANRSHVTPFDKLAQWNAQIMNLGAQGSIPSIVGNSLEFVKLTAANIPGVMNNPATEDLIMGQWDILFSANGNIGMTNGIISGVSTLSSSNNLQISSQTSTLVTGGRFEVQPILGAEIKLQCASTGGVGPINIVWPDTLDANGYNITIGGNRTSGSCQVNIMNNNYNNSASLLQLGSSTLGSNRISARQIDIDAGTTGLQLSSDAAITIDATANIEIETFTNIKMDANGDIEIDAAGRLDLSGSQIFIDSDGVGVNISAANAITMDAANIDVEATTKLDLSGTNITINSSNGNIEVKAGATLDLSSDNTKLNGNTTLDITGATINVGTSSSIVDISGQISLNKVANLTATNITADNVFVDTLHSNPQNTKITLNDNLDVNQKDISNCNTLRVDSIFQNNAGPGTTSNQLIIGNFINGSSKYIRFDNKIALYTTNSVTTANAELNGSLPNNYLIGYKDTDICGGLIYRADIGSGAMNKLITTTSMGYFSTNYFRILNDTNNNGITNRQKTITYTVSNTEPFFGVGFNYTDNLILSGGVYAWSPNSASYPPWAGTNNSSFILNQKNLQLPRDQLIRVLSFTFEGYNTTYQLNTNGFALPDGSKTYFEIVFGFGNNRVCETGPWTTEGQANFIKCFETDTSNNMIDPSNNTGNVIALVDLSLNTYYNYSTNPINNNHKPIENKAIPTYAETSSGFIYNDLQPYIFIRAMNGTNFSPWTYSTLKAASGVSFNPAWVMINSTKTLFSETVPSSDLPWTCPFGAQFMFEHYIPAVDTPLN